MSQTQFFLGVYWNFTTHVQLFFIGYWKLFEWVISPSDFRYTIRVEYLVCYCVYCYLDNFFGKLWKLVRSKYVHEWWINHEQHSMSSYFTQAKTVTTMSNRIVWRNPLQFPRHDDESALCSTISTDFFLIIFTHIFMTHLLVFLGFSAFD